MKILELKVKETDDLEIEMRCQGMCKGSCSCPSGFCTCKSNYSSLHETNEGDKGKNQKYELPSPDSKYFSEAA